MNRADRAVMAVVAVIALSVAIAPARVRADSPAPYVTQEPGLAIPTVGPLPTPPSEASQATSPPYQPGDTPPPYQPGDTPPPYQPGDTPPPIRPGETPPSYARPDVGPTDASPDLQAPDSERTYPPRPYRSIAPASMSTLLPVPAAAVGSTMTPADMKSLYENLRDAVNAIPLPPYVAFTFVNDSAQSGERQRERLQVLVRESDATAVVRTLRDRAGNAGDGTPQVVTGPLYPMTLVVRVGDFPLSDFGLRIVAPRPGIFDASGTPQPAAPGDALRTLASVTVIDLPYVMTDLGADTVNGRLVYHIGLTPKRDPGHHVLRQIWIDPDTFLPVRYVAERFVEDADPFSYFVTVDTKIIAGRLVNISAAGDFEKTQGADRLSGESRWHITGIGFPERVPSWAFDPQGIAQHSDEMIPGL